MDYDDWHDLMDERPINDDPPWTERDSIDEDRERLEDRGAYDFDGLGYSTELTL